MNIKPSDLPKPAKFEATLVSKQEVGKDVFLLQLDIIPTEELLHKPAHLAGQFYSIVIPTEDLLPMSRAYSIASIAQDEQIHFYIKILEGEGSKYIASIQEGDTLTLQGPFGLFLRDSHTDTKEDIFVGTSTGIAPFLAHIRDACEVAGESRAMKLIFGVRNPEDIFAEDVLQKIQAEYPQFSYTIYLSGKEIAPEVFEQNPQYKEGRVTKYIQDVADTSQHIYLCGNPNMVQQALEILEEKAHPKDQIHHEKY